VRRRRTPAVELRPGDGVVAEGLSKAYHDIAERVFEPPTPVLTRAFRGRRPAGLEEEVQDDDDDDQGFDDSDLEEEPGDTFEEPAAAAVWGLRDVTFRLPAGSAAAVVGGSGSGKTTLLRVLGGALPPTTGSAVLAGRPSPLINLALQLMVPTQGPEANVAVAGALVGLGRRRVRPHVASILELAEVSALERRVGVTQTPYKLAVASALLLDAQVLLLDDPFAAARGPFRDAVLETVERRRAEGATVLIETRDREAVARLCETALWLDQGRLAGAGATQEVLAAYDASAAAASAAAPHPDPATGFNETAAVVSATGEAQPSGDVSIGLRLEVARAAVTLQTGVGLERPDGFGLWFEQPDPVVCDTPGFHHFQLLAHDVPPGRYAGRVQARLFEAGAETVIGRRNVFEVAVGAPSAEPRSAAETRWERRDASWLYEPEQPAAGR
jgi:ABC-type polysaccharide/polyol phosphate transport system ATPase subunit